MSILGKDKQYHLWNPFTDLEEFIPYKDMGPMTLVRGEGAYVYNAAGKRFINSSGSLWNVAVGHGRTELAEVAAEQMKTLCYSSCFQQTHPRAVEFADKLCALTDYEYDKVYLGSNGSEAIETAVKLTRQYFRQSDDPTLRGKYKITSFKGLLTEWVGLKNYEYIFFYDINFIPTFLQVVYDTLLNTPLCMVFSLVIAILINRKMVGRGFFRTAFFIPVLLGSGYIMKQLLGMGVDGTTITTGIMVPKLISDLLGVSITTVVQGFLDRITVVLWKSGVQIVLFLAGLQGISGPLYEAARVDGATEWEMFWKITLPMITPIILMNIVYTIVAFSPTAQTPWWITSTR